MDPELPNAKNIKISSDGSAELLTLNPLPRNFNYKIIIKIQASNGKNRENRPLDKLEEFAVKNTTPHYTISRLMSGPLTDSSGEKCQLF